MDTLLQVSVDGFKFINGSSSCYNPRNPQDASYRTNLTSSSIPIESHNPSSVSSMAWSGDSAVLKYINDMLMEEDTGEQSCLLHDSLALQAAEKSFYDVLRDHSPPYDHSSNKGHHDPADTFRASSGLREPGFEFAVDSPETSGLRRYIRGDDDPENGRDIIQPEISWGMENELSEKFEDLLLSFTGNCHASSENSKTNRNYEKRIRKAKGASNRIESSNSEPVDLQNLLMQCAQAIASFDHRTAAERLKEIRLHSSRHGNGTQRLAFYFAEALEARIAGTQSPKPSPLPPRGRTSMVDILKAYKLYVQASPFSKTSLFVANRTIIELASKASTLHIIDFGILYGFQWPCLIQALSNRPGGPPKLRITGIEMPQPGYRPSERVEETGKRLKRFCDKFNVPFEYNFVAKKWEAIDPDDLVINKAETTVVNCLYRLRYVPDETVSMESPRDIVLKLFKDIHPDLFVFAEVNGLYSSPFFMTRFRETLFHFSSVFDIFEATTEEENEHRTLMEREIFVRDAMNAIACEGVERVERPETYKQWQLRTARAGFKAVKLDKEIIKEAKEMVRRGYHKDFFVDMDRHWMFQGWKGRVLYALSCWKPACS